MLSIEHIPKWNTNERIADLRVEMYAMVLIDGYLEIKFDVFTEKYIPMYMCIVYT